MLATRKRGLEFMVPLLQDMCQDDPAKRPTMDEVVLRFTEIMKGLSSWKLRTRLADMHERYLEHFFHSSAHWAGQIGRIARRIPAVPTV